MTNKIPIFEMRFLREMLDYYPFPALIVDMDYKIQYFNEILRSLLPESKKDSNYLSELIGKNNFDNIFLPATEQNSTERENKILAPFLKNKDIYYRLNVLPNFDGNNAIKYYVLIFESLTTIKSPDTGHDSSEFYFNLLDQIEDRITATDLNGNVIYVNKSVEKTMGKKRADLIGKNVQTFGENPEKGATQKEIVDSTMKNGEWAGEVVNLMPDGSESILYARTKLVKSPDETPSLLVGISTDITKQKEYEHSLKESEKKFRSLFENINVGVALHKIILDDKGKVVDFVWLDANTAYEKFTLLRKEDILGKRGLDIIPNLEDYWLNIYGKVALTGESVSVVNHSEYLDKWWEVKAYCPKKGQFAVALTDITESKKAEFELRKSEEKYRSIIETSSDGFIIISNDMKIQEANKSCESLYGYSVKEMTGLNLSEIEAKENPEETKKHIEELKNSGITKFETLHRRKDGKTINIYVSTQYHDINGGFFSSFLRDITKEKLAQNAILEERDRAQNYLDIAGVIILTLNTSGTVTMINKKGCEVLGYEKIEIIGKNWFDNFIPSDIKPIRKSLYSDILTGKEKNIEYGENEILDKNGEIKLIAWHNTIIKDRNGTIIGTLSSGEDITKQKQTERDLKINKNAIASSNNAIAFGDLNANLVYVNEAFLKMWGYSESEEVIGKPSVSFWEQQEKAEEIVRELFRGGSWAGEMVAKHQNGSTFDIQLSTNMIYDEDGKPVSIMASFVDISEQKHDRRIRLAQLNLIEYATGHSTKELLQKFLEESEKLTGSSIGFYHFLEDDQETLSIQAWSGNTLQYHCKISDYKVHYPISEAGVWVDCIKVKKPVVHNDYQSLKYKKGMPEGHVDIIRELLVPVIRKNKVKAILGVGNKISDYTNRDVNTIQKLADFAWEIIERRRTEDALIESEKKFRSITEQSSDLISLTNNQGIITYASPSSIKLFQCPPNEMIGRHFTEFLEESSVQYAVSAFRKSLESGNNTGNIELNMKRKNGEIFAGELNGSLFESADSKGTMVVIRDISQRKKAEKALQESERKWRNILMDTPQIGIALSSQAKITFANRHFLKLTGWEEKDVIGSDWFDMFIPEEISQKVKDVFLTVIKQKDTTALSTFENEIVTRSGELRMISWANVLTKDNKGEIVDVTCLGIDLTERKKAEELLKQSEMRFRNLLQDVHHVSVQGYLIDGTTMYWNKASEILYGYTPEEAIGKNLLDLIIPEEMQEEVIAAIKGMNETGKPIPSSEMTLKRKDGSYVDVYSSHAIVEIPGKGKELFCIDVDMSERKQFEEALIQSEEKHRFLFENMTQGVVYHDISGKIIYANNSASKILGLTKDQLFGKTSMDPRWRSIHEDGSPYPGETHPAMITLKTIEAVRDSKMGIHLPEQDAIRWININSMPKFSSDGKTLDEVVVTFEDITEIVNAREKAEESETRFKALHNASFGGIAIHDKGVILDCNMGMSEMSGFSVDELTGMDGLLLIAPDWRDHVMEKILSGYEKPYEVEGIRKDGEIYPLRLEARNIPYKGIKARAVEFRDITDQKNAAEALRESEQKLKNIINNTPMGIFLYELKQDDSLNFIDYNPTANKILGVDCKQFIGKTIGEAFPPLAETDMPDHYKNVARTGEPWYYEDVKYDDKIIKGFYEVYAFQTAQNYVAVMFVDVTDRKKSEAELQKISRLESLGILAGGIAHNFKNMLTAMSMSVELAKMKPERVIKHLDKIAKSIEQATALATKFQTFSKSDEPILSTTNINLTIKDSAEMALSGSRSDIQYDLDISIPPVLADEKQLNEVFTNLLINADQAMPRGGKVSVRTSMIQLGKSEIPKLKEGKYIRIEISDEGMGIPKSHLKEIFTPFFTTKEKGHGLGLASVFYIISKHRGRISVESKIDEGTKFTILLPMVVSGESDTKKAAEFESFDRPVKILLLDDDESIIENMKEIAEDLELNMTCLSNPDKVMFNYINALNSESYELVILDMTLKGYDKDGLDVLNELRSYDPDVKALVFSGHSTKPVVANYKKFGFKGRLEKPFNMKQFIKEIKRVLDL